MRQFEWVDRVITQDSRPLIIAEIGNNHNGSVTLCKTLIARAKQNGADAVKLQKRCPERLFTKALFNAPYENPNSFGPTYGAHRKALEFDKAEWADLFDYAHEVGITLFATPFDLESVAFLEQFNPPAYKVASGCLTDIPLINALADVGKPMIISTGGGSWNDVTRAFDAVWRRVPMCFLHCVASYPNRAEDMNLLAVQEMLKRYPGTVIGLSDHYQGYTMALAAYCLGARVFEKHFTTDHTLPGPDHALSIEAHELSQWVHETERLRAAMGDGNKELRPCELKGIRKMAKGIHVARPVPAGKVLDADDVTIRSPQEGLPPYEIENVLGRIAIRELSTSVPLTWEDLR